MSCSRGGTPVVAKRPPAPHACARHRQLLVSFLLATGFASSCTTSRVRPVPEGGRMADVEQPRAEPPHVVLLAFLRAVESEDFATAHHLLAEPLRRRYTVDRLEEDFAREPLARARLARARRALAGEPIPGREPGEVYFALEGGGGVRLIQEPGGYRIASLE